MAQQNFTTEPTQQQEDRNNLHAFLVTLGDLFAMRAKLFFDGEAHE